MADIEMSGASLIANNGDIVFTGATIADVDMSGAYLSDANVNIDFTGAYTTGSDIYYIAG